MKSKRSKNIYEKDGKFVVIAAKRRPSVREMEKIIDDWLDQEKRAV